MLTQLIKDAIEKHTIRDSDSGGFIALCTEPFVKEVMDIMREWLTKHSSNRTLEAFDKEV